jgi:hypothetical protein
MRGFHAEYILKGIYLGLLLFVALHEPSWAALGQAAALTLGGLALFLAVAAVRKLREGYQVRGKFLPFLLFVLLESPELVYLGILSGLLAAALTLGTSAGDHRLLGISAGGGALLGVVFWLLRYVRHQGVRIGLCLLLAVVLVLGALLWFGQLGDLGERLGLTNPVLNPTIFGVQLLLGIPLFYLLTLAGREEETEVEVGAICAALGLGVGMLTPTNSSAQSISYIVPIMLYFWYTTQVLPRLRVFKHAIRGFSYAQIGRHRQAILSFRRALQLEPANALAREGLWGVHRTLDLGRLADDPQTLALVDFEMCLERAGSLLMTPPTAAKLEEAERLLDLVWAQRADLRPRVHYWRAVARTHEHRYQDAAEELQQVLDPTGYTPDDAARRTVLLPAWQLALRSHPELAARVGTPQLALPGRRMEAIGAVERHLASRPEDSDVWAFKRSLYQDLTEAEYNAGTGAAASDFDHGYAQQLGLALVNDPARWRRGCEYLRMAARGLPAQRPSLFTYIAQAHQRAGEAEAAWRNYELAQRAGRAFGPKNLPPDERQAYFAAVHLLAESAAAQNHFDAAIENYHLYTEYERSGLETLRTLADLYERKGDPLAALRVTEQALLYNGSDKDLLARKDRDYYSVLPDDLRARLEMVRGCFDVGYCLRKAKALLDAKQWDLDLLDWAQHLAELARVVQPDNRSAKVSVARARLRRGEREEALALLEESRGPKPESFAGGDDEDAWFLATKLLGELYLYDLGRPDLAVNCFKDYRQSAKSGADTMYKLGQAYEQLGDNARAVKFYKHVVAYDGHPLAPDAYDALSRLGSR